MISSQFIQSCQSGDETAIQTLVRTYQRPVFQLALSIIDDGLEARLDDAGAGSASAEADAATRQTFITAIDRMGRFREDANFETWLFGIAIQVSRKRARGWKLRRQVLGLLRRAWSGITRRAARNIPADWQEPVPPRAAPASQEQAPEVLAAAAPPDPRIHPGDIELWSSVRRLDEKLRVPIVLRYYHDFPVADIAHLLNISEGTVHARLDAAREQIARQQQKAAQAQS